MLADGEAVAIVDNEGGSVWLESSSTIVIGSPLLGNQSETLIGSGGLDRVPFLINANNAHKAQDAAFVLRSTDTS